MHVGLHHLQLFHFCLNCLHIHGSWLRRSLHSIWTIRMSGVLLIVFFISLLLISPIKTFCCSARLRFITCDVQPPFSAHPRRNHASFLIPYRDRPCLHRQELPTQRSKLLPPLLLTFLYQTSFRCFRVSVCKYNECTQVCPSFNPERFRD